MQDTKVIEKQTAPISATYSVGRKVVAENGEHIIERHEKQVVVSVQINKEAGAVFHRGARIV